MSYESYRAELAAKLTDHFDAGLASSILEIIDTVSVRYNVEQKVTDLIVANDIIPQVVKYYLASKAVENKSKLTLTNYKTILTKFFQRVGIPFDSVTSNDIRAYLYEYKDTHSVKNSSLDRIRSCIRSFFQWCVDDERITRNPAAKIGVIKHQDGQREGLTAVELETLRMACETPREKALIDFLYSTGCRVSEVCSMRICDVDFKSLTVKVLHGKGDKQRVTYLNAEAEVSLMRYLASRNDCCDLLFVSDRKPAHGITPDAVQRILKVIASRTDIKRPIHPHLFRHTAATVAIRSGMPVEHIQRFLGHSQIGTTMIYAKADDSDVKASHAKFIA